jgi:imidazole glycerol-phosphate synthase subunit HisH
MKIGIINYGRSNIGSVRSALRFYNFDTCDIKEASDLRKADILVLAGVGNFAAAHSKLTTLGFWDALDRAVMAENKPILGICLGMQMFFEKSFENGEHSGFGWIPGEVKKIEAPSLKIPHIGWDAVVPSQQGDPLFSQIKFNYYYFMHSYHCVPKNTSDIAATTDYSGFRFVSAVRKGTLVGVQFHPEKSQIDGLRLLKNFVEMVS